jgi:putative ABC transport system permease protein
VSDAFWKSRLGADPAVVGRTIRLDDEPFTVIGVMPESFRWRNSELWVPLRLTASQQANGSNYLRMIGRLAPGVDAARATSQLDAVWAPIREANPGGNEDTRMAVETLREASTRSTRTPLFILAGAAAFVLLIACVNVANLMLVRAERRQREVSVRAALGARRGRLIAQFVTEGLAISMLGGLVGIALAWAGVRGLIGFFGDTVPNARTIGLNAPVLFFALVVSLVSGALVGAAPAMRGTIDFAKLRDGSRGGTARFSVAGKTLVVLEVALAIMLVTGAGLLLKSYARVLGSDLGFDASGLVAVNFWFPETQFTENEQALTFLSRLSERVEASPDVQGVSMASMVPIREYGNNYTEVGVEGRDATASFVEVRYVTPSFFETLGIDQVRGRNFTDQEARDNAPVMLITRTLARQLFGDDDPLGWHITIGNTPPEIIGVVDDVRDFGPDQAPRPIMYRPAALGSNMIIRSNRDAGTVADLVRTATRDVDPAVVPIRIESMEEILDRAVAGRRFQLTLIGVFALTALVLACVGIYGVLAYTVEQQTREIGVRMALGARAAEVASGVAWRGGRWALLGIGIGGIGAFGLRSTIASQLFAVESFDIGVYAAVAITLLAATAVACLVPARRAAVTDPVRALSAD